MAEKTMQFTSWHDKSDGGPEPKRIAAGSAGVNVMAPFRASFRNDDIEIELMCDVVDGQTDVVEYRVRSRQLIGLKAHSSEVARGYNLRKLMSYAFVDAAQTQAHVEQAHRSSGAVPDVWEEVPIDVLDAVVADVRRTPDRTRDEEIRLVADEYNLRRNAGEWTSWEALAQELHMSTRTVHRRKDDARSRGFLDDGSAD